MTSFSAYASRFLSTGASTAAISNHGSFTSKSNYQPFTSSEYGQDESEEEEVGYPDNLSSKRPKGKGSTSNRHLPHLNDLSKSKRYNLSGSSRFLPNFGGAKTGRKTTSTGIRDIDDGIDEDEEDEEPSFYQDHRSRISIPKTGESAISDEQRTPNASVIRPDREENDPFRVEEDLPIKSRSKDTGSRSRGLSNEGKARGWLAHGADSSSATSDASVLSRKNSRNAKSDDIYRDPDGMSDDDEESDVARQGRRASRRVKRGTGRKGKESIFADDSENDEDTSQISSSDESQARSQNTSRGSWKPGKRMRTQSGNAASSLREPLLSAAGSEVREQPPGAFNGATSRIVSADIYAYPHPPAKTGWTPWAPGNRVPLSQYKDKMALLSWLGVCAATLFIAGWMAIGAKSVSPPSSPSTRPSPYYTLTRSIPVLFLLTFLSLVAAAANLLVLRNISRVGGARILRYGLIGIPLILSLGWAWAFAGSFIYDDERWSGGGWSTTGLRILSIIPLALAIYFARNVWKKRDSISRSLSVLEISASVVAKHPVLLLLSISTLVFFIAISAPFLTIFTRLFLRGHYGEKGMPSNVWRTDSNARLMAWITLGSWIWTWLVLRGIQRVTVAGVVSHWYFHREEDDQDQPADDGKLFDAQDDEGDDSLPGPAPGEWLGEAQISMQTPSHIDIVRASFIRATGPALGTICMSAFMLSIARVGAMMAASARWAHRKLSSSSRVPTFMQPLTYVVAMLAGVSALLQGLSDYALIYVGVTGDGFAAAARRSARLTGRQGVKSVMEGLVINMLLDLTTLALCFLCGLAGFLISAHSLHVPADAPLLGLLCALMPYATLRLCADVLSNAADTLYLCFSIDEASGEQHCKQASDAFFATNESLPF